MDHTSQERIQRVNTGNYETVMMIDTYITDREMLILTDSAFAFSGDVDKNSVILNTVMSRIQNCSHPYDSKDGEQTHRVKCPITDKEMEIINNANQAMNPKSSKSALMKIQNSMEPVNKLYYININIPLDFKKEFENSNKQVLNDICNQMSFNVIGRKNVNPRHKINTYLTQKEYNEIIELSDDQNLSEDVRNFCEVIPQVTKEFSPEEERKDFLSEIEPN